jgi:hypothetical protein
MRWISDDIERLVVLNRRSLKRMLTVACAVESAPNVAAIV